VTSATLSRDRAWFAQLPPGRKAELDAELVDPNVEGASFGTSYLLAFFEVVQERGILAAQGSVQIDTVDAAVQSLPLPADLSLVSLEASQVV
jgi:hypothetical protein